MKAIQVSSFGAPEVLRLAELPDPAPGPGEVAIDVTHAAVGLIDVFIRQGLYRDRPGLPQPPYVPGLEVAGTVRALGEGVAGFEVGEPVMTLSANSGMGGYAAIFVSDAAYVASMKDVSLDPALAVAVVPNGATAHLALTQIARIRDGEQVLVHGALGGLAAGFPGIARQLGASRVVGTVRASDLDAAQQARLPYDEIIDSAELPARLAGERFDIIIDPVGGSVRTASIDLLAPGGRLLLVGAAHERLENHSVNGRLVLHPRAGGPRPRGRHARWSRTATRPCTTAPSTPASSPACSQPCGTPRSVSSTRGPVLF